MIIIMSIVPYVASVLNLLLKTFTITLDVMLLEPETEV